MLSRTLAMMRAGDAVPKNGRCVGCAHSDWLRAILPRLDLHTYRGQAENPCADLSRQLLVVRDKRNLDSNRSGGANFSVRPSTTGFATQLAVLHPHFVQPLEHNSHHQRT